MRLQVEHDFDFSLSATGNQESAPAVVAQNRVTGTLYAKDYGAWGRIAVTLFRGNRAVRTLILDLPIDSNRDLIADKWQIEQAHYWNARYPEGRPFMAPFDASSSEGRARILRYFGTDPRRPERADPAPLEGEVIDGDDDGLFNYLEYRGYLLDRGGYDSAGANGKRGHVRLNAVDPEIMIDVDIPEFSRAVAPDFPGTRSVIDGWLDRVVKSYSKADGGAQIQGYYVIHHDLRNQAPFFQFDGVLPSQFLTQFTTYVSTVRGQDFVYGFRHLQLAATLAPNVRRFILGRFAGTSSGALSPSSVRIGSLIAVQDMFNKHRRVRNLEILEELGRNVIPQDIRDMASRISLDTFVSNLIAHELAHQLVQGGHFADANGNGTANEENDFWVVLFDYAQRPLPNDYWYQDFLSPEIYYWRYRVDEGWIADPVSGFRGMFYIGRRTLSS